jgi:pimeloyl-ACP methyl ester carboxylesterase
MLNSLLSCAAYEPTAECEYDPSDFQLTPPEPTYGFEVAYQVLGGDRLDAPLVMYVGGSGEEMHTSANKCMALARTYGVRFVVFAMPGGPESHTKHRSLIDTVSEDERLAACEAVFELFKPQDIWGRSMGASAALRVADHHVHGIVLEAPLASVRTVLEQTRPRFAAALEWANVDAYSTIEAAEHIQNTHVIILCMEDDEILSPAHSKEIEAALQFQNTVESATVKGASHNSWVDDYSAYVPIQFFHPTAFSEPDFIRY